MNKISSAIIVATLACSGTEAALAAAPHAQLLIRTESCFQGKMEHPTQTFMGVFTAEQAAALDKMWVERERLSKVLDSTPDADIKRYGDVASRYFDYSNRFFQKLQTSPALVRIKRLKGWWVRLGVPTASPLVVYGYLSEEGETEPQPIRIDVKPSAARETVGTLDYTDPVVCKSRGPGNPYAK